MLLYCYIKINENCFQLMVVHVFITKYFSNTFKTTNILFSNASNSQIYSKFIEINFRFQFSDIFKNTNLTSNKEDKKIFDMQMILQRYSASI